MEVILELMKMNKLRRYELSERLNISQPTLKRYLKDPTMFSVNQIVVMADALNYPTIKLFKCIINPSREYCLDELRSMVDYKTKVNYA
jgi:transcriptional regulator with XRE-family HTH domain